MAFFSKQRSRLSQSLLIFLALTQLVFLFVPNVANAQLVVSNPTADATFNIKWSREVTEQTLLASAMGSLLNGFSYFMRKIAYDAAVYLGSAGKGQGALIYQQGGAGYFKSVGLDSVASAVDELGSPFGIKSLCNPNNPLDASLKLEASIKVSLRKLYITPEGPPEPNCKWSTIENAIDTATAAAGTAAKLDGYDIAAYAMANSLKIDETDIGKVFTMVATVEQQQAKALTAAQADLISGNGYKPVVDPISGKIKTPAQIVGEESKALTVKNTQGNVNQQIAGLYGSNLLSVIPSAASLFINTFASQLMDTVLSGGLFPDDSSGDGASGGGAASVLNEFAGVVNRNREIAQNAFNYFFTTIPEQQQTVYPLVEEFTSCPENPGLNHCVMDAGLAKGLKDFKLKPLTIAQALDPKNNVLHGNWPLIGPAREIDNVLDAKSGKKCFQEKYCYSNLQKLRKVRILPLGFEIAALKADPDHPENWTLEKVVKGFDDCNYSTDKAGVADSAHPFCHLIDPNWVIRLPEPRCEAKVYTTALVSDQNNLRTNECADISTCIAEDGTGKCIGAYGYCLREKNTWKIPGKSCSPQFNTCKTYVKSGTNQAVGYLSRTLDVGQCNAQSVGCRTYSVKPLATGGWVNSSQIPTPDEIRAGKNPTINFNGTIKAQSCPTNMEGCSALYRVNGNGTRGELEYVKKAPINLFESCYLVTNPTTGQKVWPETDGEVASLSTRPESKLCAPFAPACTREETGCEAYKPADGGDMVTGVVGGNQCNASCVGYDTFKQEQPTDRGAFEPEVFPMHFIPSTAKSCTQSEEGCSEFTNIDKAKSGGESLEYYTDLQYCELPNETNQKTYYTWEGTVNQGYVLRTHALRPVSSEATDRYSEIITNDINLPVGSPAYNEYDTETLKKYFVECSQTSYEAALANPYGSNVAKPDCRAFYDAQGKIYYRLLEKTVTVSSACHPLRKTESFLKAAPTNVNTQILCTAKGGKWDDTTNNCQVCYNGGIYQNGSCVYYTTSLPNEAKACAPAAVGCRAYSGKGANNKFSLLEMKFEPVLSADEPLVAAKAGWNTGQIRPESVTVGQYSLELSTVTAVYQFASGTLENNKFYELEFWARGNPQNLQIYFEDKLGGLSKAVGEFTLNPVTNQTTKVPISTTWQAYRLGPVQFSGDPTHVNRLIIRSNSGSPYYLDNFRLSVITDKQYLIKNSWKVQRTVNGKTIFADAPEACDADPVDGFPGAALGCRAYTDSLGRSEYTTGFDRLCRSEAVGCTAFTDSNNTVSTKDAMAFNLWCAGTQNTTCSLKVTLQGNQTDPKAGEIGTCTVPAGQTGCYVKRATISAPLTVALIPNSAITQSTVIVPADTTSTMYLSLRQEFKCENRFIGCQKVALEDQVLATSTGNAGFKFPTSSQSMVLNNPDKYDQILCSTSEAGCGEYKSGDSVSYFKDPALIGNKICEYKENVTVTNSPTGATVVSGWFQKGVGRCSNNTQVLCKEKTDCGTGANVSCVDIGAVACYDNFFNNGEYGIWSNKSTGYKGYVGTCPLEQSQCTELRDPTDTSDSTNVEGNTGLGKSYYVIFDDAIKRAAAECDGKAGLKAGCVLFDQTENPAKLYDSVATAAASAAATPKYSQVTPVAGTNKDTNILLKVVQDRQCSEWLTCKTYATVEVNGQKRKICYEYKGCRQLNGNLECGEWTNDSETAAVLQESTYTSRTTSWFGEDYSGYSLYKKFPISEMVSIFFDNDPNAYIGFEAKNAKSDCTNKTDFVNRCGSGNNTGGVCYKEKCIFPASANFPASADTVAELADSLEPGICKAFPENNSPFPSTISTKMEVFKSAIPGGPERTHSVSNLPGLEGANVCQNGDCSCEYQKVTYRSGVTDYYKFPDQKYAGGICTGGDRNGQTCGLDADCSVYKDDKLVSAGVCDKVQEVQTQLGLRGFCLEYDYSRPINRTRNEYACLTWLPVDSAASIYDNFNRYSEAGYYPALDAVTKTAEDRAVVGGQIFCTEASRNSSGVYDTDYFFDTAGEDLNALWSFKLGNQQITDPNADGEAFCLNGDAYCDSLVKNKFDANFYGKLVYSYAQKHLWKSKKYDWTLDNAEDGSINNRNTIVLKTSSLPYQHYLVGTTPQKLRDTNSYSKRYVSPLTILEPEVSNLIYLRFLNPSSDSFDMEIPNSYLKKLASKKVNSGTLDYNYSYIVSHNNFGSLNNSKFPGVIKIVYRAVINSGIDKGKVVLGGFALADSVNMVDLDSPKVFAEKVIEDFMSNSPTQSSATVSVNAISGLKNWKIENNLSSQRSVYSVYTIFDTDGEKGFTHNTLSLQTSSVDFSNIFNGHDVLIYLAEGAEIVPRCVEFAQVYDEKNLISNKAFTNATWSGSKLKGIENQFRPFGSTELDANVYLQGDNWIYGLRRYIFNDQNITGRPLACNNSLYPAFSGNNKEGYYYSGSGRPCVFNPIPSIESVYYGYTIDENKQGTIIVGHDVGSGLEYLLRNYFAMTFRQVKNGIFDNNIIWKGKAESTSDPRDKSSTTTDAFGVKLLPPQIYSLNTEKCMFGTTAGCTVSAANEITVNQRNGEEDVDGDNLTDPLYGKNNLTTVVKFFAFADHNRMPIKRVMVDWGDGTTPTNEGKYGDYKNHKPVCMSPVDTTATTLRECSNAPQLTCKTNSDCPTGGTCNVAAFKFGNTSRACTPDYFEFTHNYSCTKEIAKTPFGTLDAGERDYLYRQGGHTAENTAFVCTFTPKVQVLDNWGWCNGSCSGGNGCYSKFKPTENSIPIDRCESGLDTPWVNYKGKIIVTPT